MPAGYIASSNEHPQITGVRQQRLSEIAIVVIAFVCALAIVGANSASTRSRDQESALVQTQALLDRLKYLEEQAHAERAVSPDNRKTIAFVERLLVREASSPSISLEPYGVEPGALRYRANLDVELALIEKGQPELAEDYAVANVDRAANTLSGRLAWSIARARRTTGIFRILTGVVIFGALGAYSALVVVLLRRQQRSQLFAVRAKLAAQIQAKNERQMQALLRNSSDVVFVVDASGIVRYASSSIQRAWGHEPDKVVGRQLAEITAPNERPLLEAILEQVTVDSTKPSVIGIRFLRASGATSLVEIVLTNLLSEPGIEGILLNCRDVTEREEYERELAHRSFHDGLTGLANRNLFLERLRYSLSLPNRGDRMVGAIFLGLDGFKVVNDSLGHDAGDVLLMTVAERLTRCMSSKELLARLGGDEFGIVVDDVDDVSGVVALAGRIADCVRAPVQIGEHEFSVTATCGIAFANDRSPFAEDVLRDADTAMHQAKATGKNRHALFDQSMYERALERLGLEADLRRAIDNEELELHYQPIFDIQSGRMLEVEALVRWRHPARGAICPLKFIPIAEDTGLILPLGRWVLQEACRQTAKWLRQTDGRRGLTVSVNVSGGQFQEGRIIDDVREALAMSGLPPECLKLEITESLMMADIENTSVRLAQLRELGVRLAIDDFGTGYSSMAQLRTLPVSTLKIDRSFVSRLGNTDEDTAIVQAIVSLANSVNLTVTSEGIETVDQLEQLASLGSEQGQGYLYSKPLPAADMGRRLPELMAPQWRFEAGRRVLSAPDGYATSLAPAM